MQPLIIAHRGASELAPENTLAAFQKAVEDQAEGIEFDVQLTNDNQAVVFHDDDLRRIAGKDFLIRDLTVEELKFFDVGSWFNEKFPDKAVEKFAEERISTLAEVLEFLQNYEGIIYIELKCQEDQSQALSKAVCEAIKDSHLQKNIIVKSFNLDVIPHIKKLCPKVKTATLFSPKILILLRKEKRLINIAKELKVDFLSLHFSLVTKKLMKKAEKQNMKVAIWTADSPRWVKRSLKLGINHIITNNPARLLKKRREIFEKKSFQ